MITFTTRSVIKGRKRLFKRSKPMDTSFSYTLGWTGWVFGSLGTRYSLVADLETRSDDENA